LRGLGVALSRSRAALSWAWRASNSFSRASCSKGPLGLGLIVGESFFEPLQLLLFVRGGAIEGAQRVLDALHGADGMVGVDVRGVGSRAADEKVRAPARRVGRGSGFGIP
jgi:hypothetical protein